MYCWCNCLLGWRNLAPHWHTASDLKALSEPVQMQHSNPYSQGHVRMTVLLLALLLQVWLSVGQLTFEHYTTFVRLGRSNIHDLRSQDGGHQMWC